MKNIELKIILSNPDSILKTIKNIKPRYVGKLIQVDTYYNHPAGRLKIREINKDKAELIYYNRPNTKKSKISDIKVVPVKKNHVSHLKNILSRIFGKKVKVKKERKLWLYKSTRIHVDKVKNLGNYLELETVVRKDMASARKEHREVMDLLGIKAAKKINVSYSDLLLK